MNEPSRDDRVAAAKARMAELAGKFLDRTAQDIATMRAGLARLAQGEVAAVGDVRQLAHRMVGTGATLGFESLSERAYDIESLTDRCPDGALPDETTRSSLAGFVDALDAEFRRVKNQQGSPS
jgi:chemotaxis protein histidine kinase CheA